jgi:poly(ADP-ribose) glycohydrolase
LNYPTKKLKQKRIEKSALVLIETSLLQPILTSHDLENIIKSYKTRYKDIWNFTALHQWLGHCDEEEAAGFFRHSFPKKIRLALRLPEIIQSPIPLLKQERIRYT